MKKVIIYWLCFLFIFAITSFLFTGCKAKKTVSENVQQTKKEINNITVATNEKTTITEAFYDSITKKIPFIKTGVQDCDSICNAKVDDLLEQLDFYKKSGNNLQQMYYSRLGRYLTINTKLQKTISQLKDSVKVEEKEIEKEVFKTITITKREMYIPFLVKFLAGLGILFLVFLGFRIGKIFM